MFDTSRAFSGFAVDDVESVKQFYGETLGVPFTEINGMLKLNLAPGKEILVYPKGEGYTPADYTILNFAVDDIDTAVDKLIAAGVTFERYNGVDEKGVFRLGGPLIAWFKDPAGNVLSVIQES